MSKYVVGQKLVFVRWDRFRVEEPQLIDVTVTKIGRRWITLSNRMRFDAETRWVDSEGIGTSPGRVYDSREAYAEAKDLGDQWDRLMKRFDRIRYGGWPPHVTRDDMQTIERILNPEPQP